MSMELCVVNFSILGAPGEVFMFCQLDLSVSFALVHSKLGCLSILMFGAFGICMFSSRLGGGVPYSIRRRGGGNAVGRVSKKCGLVFACLLVGMAL